MAKKTRVVFLCIMFLLLGFVVGEFLPLPFLQDVTLTASMTRFRDNHRRR